MLVPAMQSIGHAHLLEHLQRADVGAALGAAAGEHEPDARPVAGAAASRTPACSRDGEARSRGRCESWFHLFPPADQRADERGVFRRICNYDRRSEAEAGGGIRHAP